MTVPAPLDRSLSIELSLPQVATMPRVLGAKIMLMRVTPTTEYYGEHLADLPFGDDGEPRVISYEEGPTPGR